MICDLEIINGGLISEDIQIGKKLKDSGFKIYLDIRYTCDHFGVKRYTGDFRKHYAISVIEDVLTQKTNPASF
jgi:tRNA U34 2-thiouridine synthase MnmA/TrmU